MQKLFLIFCLTLCLFAYDFEVYNSIDEIKGKKAYVLVEESYCPWCKKFKQKVLSDEEVAQKLQFHKVAIIMRNDWNKQGLWGGHVKYVPTMFFLNKKGEITKRQDGYIDKDEFINLINSLTGDF